MEKMIILFQLHNVEAKVNAKRAEAENAIKNKKRLKS